MAEFASTDSHHRFAQTVKLGIAHNDVDDVPRRKSASRDEMAEEQTDVLSWERCPVTDFRQTIAIGYPL